MLCHALFLIFPSQIACSQLCKTLWFTVNILLLRTREVFFFFFSFLSRNSAVVDQFCDMKDGDVMTQQEQRLTTGDGEGVDPDKEIIHR